MLLIIMSILVLVVAGALIFVAIRSQRSGDPLQARMDKFASRDAAPTLEEIEMSLPFTERVVFPLLRRLGDFAGRFTPQATLEAAERNLRRAGVTKLDPTGFVVVRIIFTFVLTGFMFMLMMIARTLPLAQIIPLTLFVGLVAYMIPAMLLSSRAARRRKNITKALPDALDLITICVEAGLGFDGAINKVAEKWDNELSEAFHRVIHEQNLGKSKREALRDMAERMEVPELTSFIAAVLQAEQLGVSLGRVLRIQSDQMRIKRRQMAEAEAHRAPIKMLIPMAGCIFPSIFIILLGPAVFIILNSGVLGVIGGGG